MQHAMTNLCRQYQKRFCEICMKIIKGALFVLSVLMFVSTLYNIISQLATPGQHRALLSIAMKAMLAWPLAFGCIYRESSALLGQNTILFIQICVYALTIIFAFVTAWMLKRDRLNWLLLSIAFPQMAPVVLCFLKNKGVDRFAGCIKSLLFIYGGAFLAVVTGSDYVYIIAFLGFLGLFNSISKLLTLRAVIILSAISSLFLLYDTLFKMPRVIFTAEPMNAYVFIGSGLVQWPVVLVHPIIHFRSLSQISFWVFAGVASYLFSFYLVRRLLEEKREAALLWISANLLLPFLAPNILGLLPKNEIKRKTGAFVTGLILIVYSIYIYQVVGSIYLFLPAFLGFTIIIVDWLRKLPQKALRVGTAVTGAILLAYSIFNLKSALPFFKTVSVQTLLLFFDLPVHSISRILHMNFMETFPLPQWLVLGVLILAIMLSVALAGKLNRSAWNWGFFSFFLPFIAANILPYLKAREGKFYHRPFFFMLMLTGILCVLAFHIPWFFIAAGVGFFGMLSAGPKAPVTHSASSSTSYNSSSSYGSYSTYSSKSCSACGRPVSSFAHAGERCPHCGVYWGSERTTTRY
jgi:hypothetical protein